MVRRAAFPLPSAAPSSSMFSSLSTSISEFRFENGVTPLSNFMIPFSTVCAYLLMVYSFKMIVNEKKKAYDLRKIVTLYNFTMSFASGVLFFFLLSELLEIYSRSSFLSLFCDPHSQNVKGKLIFLYYINYLFKYIELIDTAFLALRYKKLEFIHVYHHFITLLLCWTQLQVQTCMQWVLILINLFVHIFLYSYYGLYELQYDIWWKKYLTSVQIIQFMIALGASVGAMMLRILYELTPTKWNLGAPCHGNWSGSYFGLAIIVSYLYLFINLYRERYEGEQAKKKLEEKKAEMMAGMKEKEKSIAQPQPEFLSTFSPHCKPGISSITNNSTSTTSYSSSSLLSSCPAFQCAEDSFISLRTSWVNHPLHAAERARWSEWTKKQQMEQQQQRQQQEGGGKKVTKQQLHADEANLKQQKRFGTHSARL